MSNLSSRPFFVSMSLWFLVAFALGATGFVESLLPPLPQLMIGASALAAILLGALHPGLNAWLRQVNLRGFVAFHLTRYVGIAFLVMYQRGILTGEFAIKAGWGDIAAATGALLLVLALRDPISQPRWLLLWNLFGIADILLVVTTATRIAVADPSQMLPIVTFPMSLVPTFVVPNIIAIHVLVFWRLAIRRG